MINNNFESQQTAEIQKTETPSLVNTRQGVSVLYKDKYLYSKYDPSKSILNIISNLSIPEYSVILIFSPALWLGLNELLEKLPSTSTLAVFEYEQPLFDFAVQNIPENLKNLINSKIKIFNQSNIKEYFSFIQKQHFRKCLKIDFSAGSAFYKNEYDSILSLTQRVIDQFWKNRLTLIKFGRLYSKNIFKNLRLLHRSIPLTSLYNTVSKPILVLGAGESLDQTIIQLKNNKNKFFIISVDAAAAPLLENGITPDAIIAVEGQQVIEKSYIGKPQGSQCLLIMDLVSRSHVPQIVNGPYSFFISEYSKMSFFDSLKNAGLLPPVIMPLGSVGLVAMEIALRLRKNCDTPIYFSGLDFSYSAGITHAKGTAAHKKMLTDTNRLKSVYNFDAAFGNGTFPVDTKNGGKMISSKALESYALLFTDTFAGQENVFDIGQSGIDLKTEKADFGQVINSLQDESSVILPEVEESKVMEKNVRNFLLKEKNELNQLKDLFTYGTESKFFNDKLSLKDQIDELIKNKDYLYIHFPDAVGPTNQQSFYNRIRIELDFFIKEISLSLTTL